MADVIVEDPANEEDDELNDRTDSVYVGLGEFENKRENDELNDRTESVHVGLGVFKKESENGYLLDGKDWF